MVSSKMASVRSVPRTVYVRALVSLQEVREGTALIMGHKVLPGEWSKGNYLTTHTLLLWMATTDPVGKGAK